MLMGLHTPPASSMIVADYEVAEAPPADESSGDWDIDWDFVYLYKNSSAVAVAPHWILTAAHVADDGVTGTIIAGSLTNQPVEIVFHSPDYDPNHTNKADLALVRYAQAFPGHYPLYEGAFPTAPPQSKLSAVLIGYGRTGTVFSTYFNETAAGNGTRRWGTQRMDGTTQREYDSGGVTGVTRNNGVDMNFDLSDTPYEAGLGVYDSGGGAFVFHSNEWRVAGINTTRFGSGTNYAGVFAVSMPAYADWIQAVLDPEADLDGDGLPNGWEQQHSTSITGLVATADNDEDGLTNIEEYQADTDPNDADSVLRIGGVSLPPVQELIFTGSTGRVYQAWERLDLVDTNAAWQASHTNAVWGAGGLTTIILTNESPLRFYRLQVSFP
jgi:hypothetical protein